MDTEIKAEFEKAGFSLVEEDEILQKCLTYCINYKLSPADLVANWDIYFLNRQLNGLRIEASHLDGFLTHLQNDQKERLIKEEPNIHIYSSNDIDMLHGEEQDDIKEGLLISPNHLNEDPYLESNVGSTPATSEKPSSTTRSKLNSRITPFGQRMNKFVSQFTFNGQIVRHSSSSRAPENMFENMDDDVIRRVQPNERCSLHIHCSLPERGCRFMYDRIEDRFNSLEDRIRRHSHAFTASGLYGEPDDATLASQKNIFAVGMICCDGEGRLNDKSIMLQCSVEHSGGQSVRIDLQRLDQFSFFPGQVIGIEGHNPSGHCLMASKVIENLPLAPDVGLPPAKKQAMDHEQNVSSITSRVLSVVIAAGPFTTTDNMLFEPFKELLAYATRRQPQLLILMGPFLDSEHPEIKKGTVDRLFDEIFSDEILRRLQDYIQYMGSASRIVLVPSIRDANHDFVFPQPAFDIEIPDDAKQQISFLANPCSFSTNEILFDCCTVDILKQLSSEELSRNSFDASVDRIGRLAKHLLNQHSFYPLYPPSESVPLDLSLAPEALDIPSTPDVLLLPSDLAPFVKALSYESSGEEGVSCMCVNPGRLAKGIGGGTFVELNYNKDSKNSYASIIRI
ncbi:DNA polymerase alpha subunit B [Phalaenopsis equestris]|uniref:DNA polymerase alpha subunit B n=1 Tax=Phalaenopsis equestris TaxID=78828 RepID=UPI0009E1B504|nr:DNA polymerase alpha subunit B [Phalaenopsis equestris]